ncbi:hypothetical protein SCOR_24180 [Sulfidibacter corallicola]
MPESPAERTLCSGPSPFETSLGGGREATNRTLSLQDYVVATARCYTFDPGPDDYFDEDPLPQENGPG